MHFKLNYTDKYVDNGPTERENLEPMMNFKITYTKAKVCFSRVISSETGPLSPQSCNPLTAIPFHQVFF